VVAAVHVFSTQHAYVVAQQEYDRLRLQAPQATPFATAGSTGDDANAIAEAEAAKRAAQLMSINSDYIGWIIIEDTTINYPVVQTTNNDTYLHTTFEHEYNASGTIFMDSRCTGGFSHPAAIVYGHNMMDGSMFASLNKYLDIDFLSQHLRVTVITPDGKTHRYTIFKVLRTNSYDEAYDLPDKSPAERTAFLRGLGASGEGDTLMLSTCTSAGNSTERIIIFATKIDPEKTK
jgi:SrtB family sortase